MNKEELTKWLSVEGSVEIQMPNEVFDDFNEADFQSYNHKCFAYSYYYIINYLYRNVVYGREDTKEYSLEKLTKVFLSNHKKVYYITKSGGLLDSIGYTNTTRDYPVTFYMDDSILSFYTVKEVDDPIHHNHRLSVKVPIKSFYRFDFDDLNGTYYSFQSTHRVGIQNFIDIISNPKLGHVAFYIFSYLSMMCDRFKDGYQVSNKELASLVGCTERTITKYTGLLEEFGLLQSTRKSYEYKLLEKIYKVKKSL